MSVQRRTVAVPATTEEQIVSITCDLCGKVVPHARELGRGEIGWPQAGKAYAEQMTTVFASEGYAYPDCSHSDQHTYHICLECFKTKLEPWLTAQGANPTLNETDL